MYSGRRWLYAVLVWAALSCPLGSHAQQQGEAPANYPAKPIRILSSSIQGGGTARVLGRAVLFPRSGSTLVHKKGVRRREPGPNEYDEDGIRPTSAGGSTFDRYSREVA